MWCRTHITVPRACCSVVLNANACAGAGWLLPQATGSDEAEEAPLAEPISLGMLGGEQEGGNAPADKSVAESLMQTFVHAYCGEAASGLAFEATAVSAIPPCHVQDPSIIW